MAIDLNLKAGDLQEIVSAAILKSLDEEKRNALIEGAIKYLLTPGENRSAYSSRPTPSPLQEAYNSAIYSVAVAEVRKLLESDQRVKDAIAQYVTAGITAAAKSGNLAESIGALISKLFEDAAKAR
jgi:hypothetical protein